MGTLVQFILLQLYKFLYISWGALVPAVFVAPCPVFTVGKPRLVVVMVPSFPIFDALCCMRVR